MSDDWTATIASERMQIDQEFADRIDASSFNRQQWGLVMTALELDVEDPGAPDAARIVPDMSSVPAILPELDSVGQPGYGGAPGGGGGGSGGGIVDSVKGALGLGGSDDERLEEATELATEYCERLQQKLESNGRWDDVRRRAQG